MPPTNPSIIFDTSGWNQLLNDPHSLRIVSSLNRQFFVRVTATNVAEIAATPQSVSRKALVELCGSVVSDCLYPPHWITNELIKFFNQSEETFDWWNVSVEWPELQAKLCNLEFFDDELAKAQCSDLRSKERDFKELYSPGRNFIEEAFNANPQERPANFHDYLAMIPGELIKKGQSFYQEVAKRELPEQGMAKFLAACPPFRALVYMAFVPEYEHWIRKLNMPESYRAGANDLFSAVYLPYCNVFVTHDQRQLNALRLVATEGNLGNVDVFPYEEFRKQLEITSAARVANL